MATAKRTIDYILEQAADAGGVSARMMFGEYALYCGAKTVAFVCDDQLFLKPTAAGRELAPDATEAPAYPGSKPYLLIDPDLWEDADWLCSLIRATAEALPEPKPKRKRKRKKTT